jgi:SAM-dependent methyltransferase
LDGISPSSRVVRAIPGTHELVVETALRYVSPGGRALDLGAGSGALAERLQKAGFRVTAADLGNSFELDTPFVQLDFNDPEFDRKLGTGFDFISSVEVIEHLENPTAFLRSITRLLNPGGVTVLTTPNVENIPARLKFFRGGMVRTMEGTNPEHVTPIHLDLFKRQIVGRSGMVLLENFVHPKGAFPLTGRKYFVPLFWLLSPLLKGPALSGDCHVFVLQKPNGQK